MRSTQLRRHAITIRIGPPSVDVAERWGDTHFARSFAKSLRRLGYNTRISLLSDWESPRHQVADIVLHIRGLVPSVPLPGRLNVLWIISHPDDVSPRECERFDLVLVASESYAASLAKKVNVPVEPLLQATDPDIFYPREPEPDLRSDVLFLGNSRGVLRPAVKWAIEAGLDLSVYGWGWEGLIPRRFIKADHFPNREAARLYSSARVVLNDHWPDMAAHGFISNRIYDAVACGAYVLSDPVPGLKETFGEAVGVFRTGEELARLAHSEGAVGRAPVSSFAARVADFLEYIDAVRPCDIAPPSTVLLPQRQNRIGDSLHHPCTEPEDKNR